MKRTPAEKEEEKRFVFEYNHTPANLSLGNTKIVWKTGIYIALLFIALFIASYYVSEKVICWLTFLMPIGALVIARMGRIRKTYDDIQFHTAWTDLWGMSGALALVPSMVDDLPILSMFGMYYATLIVGFIMLLEMMRMRYASLPLIAASGIAATGLRESIDPEGTIRGCLVFFILFNLLAILIGGFVMQWQVKKHIQNPINFPQEKK